ncbi:MAG: folylpolyglutamate synthase/dihydrofolate synthase family protein [Candidatus Promineifilaceae bacterium]
MFNQETPTPDYAAAHAYLLQFINYEKQMPELYGPDKMDPSRPGRLLAALGSPHTRLKAVHIAGTKGKGSVAAFCAFALRAAGLKVGLYTSPHLVEFRERLRILTPNDADGRISQAEFVALVAALQQVVPTIPGLTWFELVTALAFMHFARQQVDVAVIEVGLGGRLDATNTLTPLVSVITSISYDHTALLGQTLPEIAAEKGGIIKPGIPVVIAPQEPPALARLQEIAAARRAAVTLIGQDFTFANLSSGPPASQLCVHDRRHPGSPVDELLLALPLLGQHQQVNAVTALAALDQIRPHFPQLNAAAIARGFASASWPGRLQLLQPPTADTPGILLDGAHNGDSAVRLSQALRELYPGYRLWFLVGVTRDKDIAGILHPLLPHASGAVAIRSSHPRTADPTQLQQIAASLGYTLDISPALNHALQTLWQQAVEAKAAADSAPGDLICVTGSLFIIGDLLNQWERLQSDLSKPTSS